MKETSVDVRAVVEEQAHELNTEGKRLFDQASGILLQHTSEADAMPRGKFMDAVLRKPAVRLIEKEVILENGSKDNIAIWARVDKKNNINGPLSLRVNSRVGHKWQPMNDFRTLELTGDGTGMAKYDPWQMGVEDYRGGQRAAGFQDMMYFELRIKALKDLLPEK